MRVGRWRSELKTNKLVVLYLHSGGAKYCAASRIQFNVGRSPLHLHIPTTTGFILTNLSVSLIFTRCLKFACTVRNMAVRWPKRSQRTSDPSLRLEFTSATNNSSRLNTMGTLRHWGRASFLNVYVTWFLTVIVAKSRLCCQSFAIYFGTCFALIPLG